MWAYQKLVVKMPAALTWCWVLFGINFMNWVDAFFSMNIENFDIARLFELKSQYIQKSIFKYREFNEYSIKNLEEDSIWLADVNTFNDPYDCACTFDSESWAIKESKRIMKEQLKNNNDEFVSKNRELILSAIESDNPIDYFINFILNEEQKNLNADVEKSDIVSSILNQVKTKSYEDMIAYSSKKNSDNFKICCFSEKVDSMLMWAHYADSHKGFCIEYDMANISKEDRRKRFLFPVIYSNDIFNVTDFMVVAKNKNPFYFYLAALKKAEDWKYEKEWRLVFFGTFESAQSFEMGKPKCIYLGANMLEKQQRELINICERKHIPYIKMRPNPKILQMESSSS